MVTITLVFTSMILTSILGLVSSNNNNCNATESWLVPQISDTPLLVTAAELANYILSPAPSGDDIEYLLLTRLNSTEPQKIRIGDVDAIKSSTFNPNRTTFFVVHGWMNKGDSPMCINISKALIANIDTNVFIVNWGNLSVTANYMAAAKSTEFVGDNMAKFMDFLYSLFPDIYDKIKVIGHSLGAHCAGFAGKRVSLGRIRYILGLDPAQPLFDFCTPEKRLSDTDAAYVETMHTNTQFLGFKKPIGNASFYPNGGEEQKGCGMDAFCSHMRAIFFYVQAINGNKFTSVQCGTYIEAENNECGTTPSEALMAWPTNSNINGTFYVDTPEGAGIQDGFPYFVMGQILGIIYI